MALPRIDSTGVPESDLILVAQRAQPRLVLTFYDHAVILRKIEQTGTREYPVDPTALSKALAAESRFSTGLLPPYTLSVAQSGALGRVIGYRPAGKVGLWLEGATDAVRIPLPPLVLMRNTRDQRVAGYNIFAVKGFPKSPKTRLYNAPFPNNSGSVCWGTVARPSAKALGSASLEEDWTLFLGSRFGNHSPGGKSQRQPQDIRKLYLEIEGTEKYPLDDLVYAEQTLGQWLTL